MVFQKTKKQNKKTQNKTQKPHKEQNMTDYS